MIDPLENNLFDLPDYENTEDEKFPPLPPPASPGAAGADWAEPRGELEESTLGRFHQKHNIKVLKLGWLEEKFSPLLEKLILPNKPDGNQQSQTKDSSAVTRKAVKRSVPKLDAHRLVSERGLPALRHMFDNVKFKGKGHETEDLKTLIRHMEHWAHRLFPKLQFDDFIDKVESLGSKKEVQTCLKRIRLDLPILSEDFTSNEDGAGESNGLDTAKEEVFPFSGNVGELDSLPGTTLTEEQQQRIKRNRQLALERRQAKMQCSSQSQHNELSPNYPEEEEFNTPIAQDLADVTEDPQVTVPTVAVTEAEDRDTELECASEKQ